MRAGDIGYFSPICRLAGDAPRSVQKNCRLMLDRCGKTTMGDGSTIVASVIVADLLILIDIIKAKPCQRGLAETNHN
jgi:hypothetical protein